MCTADTYVRARIDTNTKERAAEALEAMEAVHFGRYSLANAAHCR